jgi:hypothetical protein
VWENSDERGDFGKAAQQAVGFFLVVARMDETAVGDGGNAGE